MFLHCDKFMLLKIIRGHLHYIWCLCSSFFSVWTVSLLSVFSFYHCVYNEQKKMIPSIGFLQLQTSRPSFSLLHKKILVSLLFVYLNHYIFADTFTRSKSVSKIHADCSHISWFSPTKHPGLFITSVPSVFFYPNLWIICQFMALTSCSFMNSDWKN